MTEDWVSIPHGRIRVFCDEATLEGESDKRLPFLLLHGFGGQAAVWEPMLPMLRKNRQVIRLDLPGHGQSDVAESYAVERQAAAVLEVLDRLGVAVVHGVAHSAGGDTLTSMIEQQSNRFCSASFLGTAPNLSFVHMGFEARVMRVPWLGRLLWAISPDGALRRGLRPTFAPKFGTVPQVYVSGLRALRYDTYLGAIHQLEIYKTTRDLCVRLEDVDVPLFVIFGRADQWVSPEAALRWRDIAHASICMLDDVGHTPMAEAPEETAALLVDHATRLDPGRH